MHEAEGEIDRTRMTRRLLAATGSLLAAVVLSLSVDQLTEKTLAHIRALHEIAAARGQSLAQMAVSWVLRDSRVTSALIGASSVAQLEENLAAADKTTFTPEEIAAIDKDAVEAGINIWAASSSH